MKVLQLTTHLDIGGIANYILTLSRSLSQRGVTVIVASSGGELESELARYGISHRKINIRTKSELDPKVLRSILTVRAIVAQERPDIIHAHTRVSQVVAFFVSRITGVPYVTTCHGFFKTRARKIFDTWGAKVIAISAAVKGHLIKDLGVSEKRVELIYSGVDIEAFSKDCSPDEVTRIKKELGLHAGPLVGTIGRLSPVKGQAFLIKAMEDVLSKRPDVRALIVGDGPEENALKDLARSLNIEYAVKFLRADLDTHRILSSMDVFVFPSIKEGLGIALLEAMASGRPCVASDVGGIGNIIKDGINGLLVGPGDAAGIASSILALLDDDVLRKSVGNAARALVKERFSLTLMTDGVMRLYEDVVKG